MQFKVGKVKYWYDEKMLELQRFHALRLEETIFYGKPLTPWPKPKFTEYANKLTRNEQSTDKKLGKI